MRTKNIIITGASQGIGKELAYEFAARGYELLLLARNVNALKSISEDIYNKGGIAYYQSCDVTQPENMKNAIDYAKKLFTQIDIAILNSGVSINSWFEDSIINALKNTFDVNVFGVANGLEALIPVMKSQSSGIIAGVSSISDFRAIPGSAAYASSKTAVSFLLEAARIELKNYGIKIITIRPGFVRTNMTARHKFKMPFLWDADKAAKHIANRIERGKLRINFPLPMHLITAFTRLLPGFLYDIVGKVLMKQTLKNKK